MREIGLIFQDWGIREILEQRKMQTRRLHGLQRINEETPQYWRIIGPTDSQDVDWAGEVLFQNNNTGEMRILHPRLQVGDIMYAKETWHGWFPCDEEGQPVDGSWHIRYRADGAEFIPHVGWDEGPLQDSPHDCGIDKEPNTWKSSMFMPKWAARIRREIIRVRVQRVQDISEKDAIAEGLTDHVDEFQPGCSYLVTAKEKYQDVWNHINGVKSWQQNPWVWVYSWQ